MCQLNRTCCSSARGPATINGAGACVTMPCIWQDQQDVLNSTDVSCSSSVQQTLQPGNTMGVSHDHGMHFMGGEPARGAGDSVSTHPAVGNGGVWHNPYAWVANSSTACSCTHLQLSTSALLLMRSPLLPGHSCAQAADLLDCRHCSLGIQQLLPLSRLHGVRPHPTYHLGQAGPVQEPSCCGSIAADARQLHAVLLQHSSACSPPELAAGQNVAASDSLGSYNASLESAAVCTPHWTHCTCSV